LKILFLDIEISPTLVTVWGLWNQNIGIQHIIGNSEVLSWAAAWHGEDVIHYSSLGMTSKRNMMKGIYKLLDEADAVVTYNGDNFDLKILRQEFLLQGWNPPTPFKSVDLLKTMKKQFRGTSNKLDYWLKRLDLGAKIKHRGHQLWLDCMNKVPGAFEEMETYNVGDVEELEKLFDRVLPWIKGLPNRSVVTGDLVCPQCGSAHYQSRGSHVTAAGSYKRYQCQGCGFWFRAGKTETRLKDKFVGV
jgi:predicted RNA-binding Zn-ribbon protein involved in translation (DUF1610 family)